MHLRIEAASERLFRSQYPELADGLESSSNKFMISEEPVGFGPGEDLILVGLVFVWESIASGITWDIIRAEVLKVLGMIERPKLRNVSIYIESEHPSERYEIECTYGDNSIEITIPKKLRLKIR